MNRRSFIKRVGVALAGVTLLGGVVAGVAHSDTNTQTHQPNVVALGLRWN